MPDRPVSLSSASLPWGRTPGTESGGSTLRPVCVHVKRLPSGVILGVDERPTNREVRYLRRVGSSFLDGNDPLGVRALRRCRWQGSHARPELCDLDLSLSSGSHLQRAQRELVLVRLARSR